MTEMNNALYFFSVIKSNNNTAGNTFIAMTKERSKELIRYFF